MPVLKHAKKKLRQDKKRTLANTKVEDAYKRLVKAARKSRKPEAISKAFQAIDKAAKHFVIHKNKAARLKSGLSKLVAKPASGAQSATKAVVKSVTKKAATKKKSSSTKVSKTK